MIVSNNMEDKKMSKKEFVIPVEWSCCGVVRVEAETIEDALNMIENDTNTDGSPFSLPEGNYIDDSFAVTEGFSAFEILKLYNRKLLDEDR